MSKTGRQREAERLVVAAWFVRRLGDGDYERGQRLLEHVIADIRARRILLRSR